MVKTECTTGLDACLYSSVEANGVQTTTRSCIKAPNGKAECVDVGTGDAAYKQCYCMTDNCNMMRNVPVPLTQELHPSSPFPSLLWLELGFFKETCKKMVSTALPSISMISCHLFDAIIKI